MVIPSRATTFHESNTNTNTYTGSFFRREWKWSSEEVYRASCSVCGPCSGQTVSAFRVLASSGSVCVCVFVVLWVSHLTATSCCIINHFACGGTAGSRRDFWVKTVKWLFRSNLLDLRPPPGFWWEPVVGAALPEHKQMIVLNDGKPKRPPEQRLRRRWTRFARTHLNTPADTETTRCVMRSGT